MLVQPIKTAPVDDRWYLIQEEPRDDVERHSPWIIATRNDSGFHDGEGYPVEAIGWVPLPDPQPKPTGWRKAVGTIFVSNGWLGDERKPIWVIGVTLPDGKNDDGRDWDIRATKDQAVTAACHLSALLGLPWSVTVDNEDTSNVLPFVPIGGVQ